MRKYYHIQRGSMCNIQMAAFLFVISNYTLILNNEMKCRFGNQMTSKWKKTLYHYFHGDDQQFPIKNNKES